MPDVDALLAEEVADTVEFLRGLSDDQWQAQSLCTDFTVRDVVGHMISASEVRLWQMPGRVVRAGFNPAKVSLKMSRDSSNGRSDEELIQAFADCDIKQGLAGVFSTASFLVDRVVHHQDMRRPLGLPRTVPNDRLVAALDTAVGGNHGVGGNKRAKGLTLRATDIEWSHGSGPVVEGPGEALLMGVCGRGAALTDLTGDGLDTLRSRAGG